MGAAETITRVVIPKAAAHTAIHNQLRGLLTNDIKPR